MCTLHANSAREALVKMCTLPLLAGENVSAAFVVPTVASCVDVVVHLGLDAAGHRKVREVVGVAGRVEGEIIETSDIFSWRDGQSRGAHASTVVVRTFERKPRDATLTRSRCEGSCRQGCRADDPADVI
jgi:pilus assembly protein CpaF